MTELEFGSGGFIDDFLQELMFAQNRAGHWNKVNNLHYGVFVEPGYLDDQGIDYE